MRRVPSLYRESRLAVALSILYFAFLPQAVFCQEDESLGREAEQAGKLREALGHYVAALQQAEEGSDKDARLREKIIAIALRSKPAPTIPPNASRFEGRAEAAARAKDYLDAAQEYRAASRQAPWCAPYYLDLGIVLEKAGRFEEAIRNLKFYLLAAPNAADSPAVQKKIGELEYNLDRLAKARKQVEQEEADRRTQAEAEIRHRNEQLALLPTLLIGRWEFLIPGSAKGQGRTQYEVSRTGDTFKMRCIRQRFPTDDPWGSNGHWGACFFRDWTWEWALNGKGIQGRWINDETTFNDSGKPIPGGKVFTGPLTGEVDLETETIHLEYTIYDCSVDKHGLHANQCHDIPSRDNYRKVD